MRLGSSASTGEYWSQSYGYSNVGALPTTNNGNIKKVTQNINGVSSTFNTYYAYDGLNRICNAVERVAALTTGVECTTTPGSVSWQQRYGYDGRGNRTSITSTIPLTAQNATSFDANNRITNTGFNYDGRGNVSGMPSVTSTDKFFYDAEDRQVTFCASTTAACGETASEVGKTIFRYDAEGKRVQKEVFRGNVTRYVYDTLGRLALEDGTVGTVIGGTAYLTRDHLGSTRVVSRGSGVVERHDFLPFGEEVAVASGNPRFGVAGYGVDVAAKQKFTSKERDAETGLDYFGARYMSSSQGRFTSPDWAERPEAVPYADFNNPQTLNLYAYVRNNPLVSPDIDGHIDALTRSNAIRYGYPPEGSQTRLTPNQAQAVSGTFKVALGVGLMATVATGNLPATSAGTMIVANSVISAASMTVGGAVEIAGSVSNTDVSKASTALSATSNLSGLATTVATGGNLELGKVASNATSMVTLGVKLNDNPMNVVENPASAIKGVKDSATALGIFKSAVASIANFFNSPSTSAPPRTSTCESSLGGCK